MRRHLRHSSAYNEKSGSQVSSESRSEESLLASRRRTLQSTHNSKSETLAERNSIALQLSDAALQELGDAS
ncbi:unnamed protein product [Cuscuta campestris]|uniref:Uncharacterized protein n=1 Tax=Cuscuta campestris TaxID=132261 RepID=A0A484N8Z5_9ASTE|nr:unnamed protein product [Cuscuta campestris]